jgi:hypothetical protein
MDETVGRRIENLVEYFDPVDVRRPFVLSLSLEKNRSTDCRHAGVEGTAIK